MNPSRRTPRFLLVGLLLAPAGPMSLFAMMLGVLAAAAVDLSCSTTEAMTVSSHTWTRSIAIQRWAHVTRSGWCDDVPPGATIRQRSSRTAALGRIPHRSTHDHHRSVPHRTRAWCTYEVDDWQNEPPAVASGTDDPRTWPQAPSPDACPEKPALGCVRGGARTEILALGLDPADSAEPAAGSAKLTCPVSEPAWHAHAVGDPLDVQFSVLFHRPRCAAIE